MNRQIRRVAVVLGLLYVALFARLNMLQLFQAPRLNAQPGNDRQVRRDFERPRGPIVTVDGDLVAYSEQDPTKRFEFQRRYPRGDLYAHVSGYFGFEVGSTGVERTYGDDLAGQSAQFEFRRLTNIFSAEPETGSAVLNLESTVQKAARDTLGDQRGSVVALDPRSGRVLGLWSNPSFDPNLLANNDLKQAKNLKVLLDRDPSHPLRARSYRDVFFPGSTFKVVTAAAALRTGAADLDSPVFDEASEWTPPGTVRPLRNSGGMECGGALAEILARSCNTAFAQLGSLHVGPAGMVASASAFGFGETPPIDLPGGVASRFPADWGRRLGPGPEGVGDVYENSAGLAQASIGQGDVSATPLEMALVVSGVANGGRIMAPHVVNQIKDRGGKTLRCIDPEVWKEPLTGEQARTMQELMKGVVTDGTADNMGIDGFEVGAKTGTAQTRSGEDRSHAWMVAFGGPAGAPARVAVAVIVEAQDGVSEQTGKRVAGPIARTVMEAALNLPDRDCR